VSHRHDFFGATTTTATSSAGSLLAGGTTCRSVDDRSAYWAPSLLAGGRPVTPSHVAAYYRTPVGADARGVQPLPNGLAMIAGDAEATTAQDPGVVHWTCGLAGDASPVPARCPGTGAELRLVLVFPPCWDGEHLRSAAGAPAGGDPTGDPTGGDPGGDLTAHLARLSRPAGGDGPSTCPASHPVLLPEVTLEIRYPAGLPAGELTLASGPRWGGHGDVLVAWDEAHLASEVDTCLRRNLTCDVVSEPDRLGTPEPAGQAGRPGPPRR
jgi:hypothetical protein